MSKYERCVAVLLPFSINILLVIYLYVGLFRKFILKKSAFEDCYIL